MARRPLVPTQLLRAPFTVEEARRAGLDRWHLAGASWKRVGRGLYTAAALPMDPVQRLGATLRRLPHDFVFSGMTAAWLHGLDVEPCDPIEVTVPPAAGISGRSGIRLHRALVDRQDVVTVRRMRATSMVRTLADLSGRLPVIEAVVLVDAALHARRTKLGEIKVWADAHTGRPGVRTLREVITHAEPASESPMESRLRMILVLGGLPRPKAQVSIHDRWGRFVGRPDLYYADHHLGIEYDGGDHRNAMAHDDRRQNRLLNSGVRLLRFTAGDVFGNPSTVVAQVAAMLDHRPR